MKKVLILSGSPRKNGNSDLLCNAFMEGAQDSGHNVEKICIASLKIAPCLGCYACHKGDCCQKDDMADLLQKMIDADVIVLASPVYFYAISAQLKAVIDRTVARWKEVKDKEFYYLLSAAENEADTFNGPLACCRGYVACVDGAEEKGMVCAGGVYEKGEVLNTEYMKQALELGRRV